MLLFTLPLSANASVTYTRTGTSMRDIRLTGRVIDETGQPLIGVGIKIKGATGGTSTDVTGAFTISVPDNATLVLTYIGYDTQEILVGNQTSVTIKMLPSSKSLNEVVVIGYGTQKKSNVTGSISSLKNDNLDQRPITRVDQALVGQLAGVNVKQTTGVPGKPFSIQVRGNASISAGNEPLYVVDGFPLTPNASNVANGSYSNGNPLDNINPADIENIEVLKDAAAAAIYGSRASNGVVLITTKRGKSGAPRITLNTSVGYNQASKQLKMLNDEQWIARATEIINGQYIAKAGAFGATVNDDANTRRAKLTASGLPLSGNQINTAYMPDPRWAIPGHPGLQYYNWQDVIERKGLMQTNELSISGSTDAVSYYVSGGYQDQNGFITGLGYKQYTVRANVEVNLSKKLKVGVNVAPSYSITQDPGVEGKDAIFSTSLTGTPLQEDSVGLYPNFGKNAVGTYSGGFTSPLGKLENNVNTLKKYRTLTSGYAEYQILPRLSFKTSVNYDNSIGRTNVYTPYFTQGTVASRIFSPTNLNVLATTSGSYNEYQRQTFVIENTLNFNASFKKVHTLSLLLGQSYNTDRLDNQSASSVGGYNNATVQTLSAAAGTSANSSATRSVLESYFARAQYSYKDKYLLLASIRSDGSSRFGENNKFGIFPAASLAWRVIQEDFMKKAPVFSDLKIRFSFGVNGNSNIGDYASISQIGNANIVAGGTPAATIGQAPSNLANPSLQWEKSQTYDGGLDFGLFNNRLTGSFDYYNKFSDQLLLFVQVPEITGFGSYLSNAGSMRSVGEELELTSRNIIGRFAWSTSLNISHNQNKIVSLGAGQNQIIIPNSFNVSDAILRVGESLNSVYVLKYNGFLTAADVANKVPTYGAESVGDPKFEDYNSDGTISEADKQIVGHPNPSYTFGITNTFRFKNFELSVLVQGQQGGTFYSELARAIARPGQAYTDNVPASIVNRWYSETNTGDGRYGKAYATYNSPFAATQDAVYSSDYIRVRNITLGYNFKPLIKTPVIQAARAYISLENFFGADKYTNGLNPDAANTTVSTNSNYPQAGDYGGLPLAKSIVFGLNFTF
ncbi:TonB-dependent receptor [Mucilaginibacter sp. HMF5004]|nr:TonB-dependent receptor [Mucilaginibacter rivuli]